MMKMNPKFSVLFPVALMMLLANLDFGSCRVYGIVTLKRTGLVGGFGKFKGSENNNEIVNLARFAVDEHNKRANCLLDFAKVLKVKEQVVAGKVYHLTLEAIDAGKTKIYEAKVWVKPWMNFKQLQEFKRASSVSPFTSADLGVMQGR